MGFTFKTNPRSIGDQKPRTVTLKGQPILKEGIVISGPIKPGQLVEFTGKGIRKQSTLGQNCRRAIAMENDLLGKGIGLDPAKDTDMNTDTPTGTKTGLDGNYPGNADYKLNTGDYYSVGNNVRYGSFHAGQEAMVRFETSKAGETELLIGTPLMAKGDGSFTPFVAATTVANAVTVPTNTIIAYSLIRATVNGNNKEILIPVEIA